VLRQDAYQLVIGFQQAAPLFSFSKQNRSGALNMLSAPIICRKQCFSVSDTRKFCHKSKASLLSEFWALQAPIAVVCRQHIRDEEVLCTVSAAAAQVAGSKQITMLLTGYFLKLSRAKIRNWD